jgi:hypothetical protein
MSKGGLAMKVIARLLVVVACFSNAAALWAQYPPPVDIPIQNLLQGTQVWCWAAVAQQLIAAAIGPEQTPQQCALVAMAYGAPPETCCSGYNPACITVGSLQQIQLLISRFGHHGSAIAPPTDPMTLYSTLASGHPIVLQVATGQGASHVVVLRGMSFLQTAQGVLPVLYINDPMAYFTQPVSFFALQGIWMDAIVIY